MQQLNWLNPWCLQWHLHWVERIMSIHKDSLKIKWEEGGTDYRCVDDLGNSLCVLIRKKVVEWNGQSPTRNQTKTGIKRRRLRDNHLRLSLQEALGGVVFSVHRRVISRWGTGRRELGPNNLDPPTIPGTDTRTIHRILPCWRLFTLLSSPTFSSPAHDPGSTGPITTRPESSLVPFFYTTMASTGNLNWMFFFFLNPCWALSINFDRILGFV